MVHKVRVFLKKNAKCISIIWLLSSSKSPVLNLLRARWPLHQPNDRRLAQHEPKQATRFWLLQKKLAKISSCCICCPTHRFTSRKLTHAQLQLMEGCYIHEKNRSGRHWELTRLFWLLVLILKRLLTVQRKASPFKLAPFSSVAILCFS